MPELREVELRIAVAEGVLSRAEAEALGEEARRKKQSPLALLVEQGRLSEDSFQSILAEAMNDPVWRAAGADASASTYTMQTEPPPPSEPPFPVAGWDRYTPVRFLGQGGMGMVFLAIDTRLRREVAIKFVRGNNADHVRRLISEARNQARVSHERICKVYEVDEVEGKVYIAMQYIAGKPLGRMADELTLEQKLTLVRGAAEGIHAAHTEGIIHRDIKPSNIMIERRDDGELRPYVMDFGLARSAQDVGETQTGAVIGTPRYMSPEQAQGATSKLDRRADVYSLGATLYHLVTGEPAVPGETVAEVIHNLIELEPRPLRAHDPGVPIDLEAVVLKCLEKERAARYDSARALADDLGRFLNGEPVVARPADTWYRLRKRLAKHRRLVAAAAVALVALVVAIGWAILTRVEAAEREQFARRFTEAVESIESTARYSALSPSHDIRGDQKTIREQMAAIEAEIERGGEAAAGPGHYALGRGFLALDDNDRALAHLTAAWNGGYREPRVAYALAQAMGRLYQRNLLAAERIEARDTREAAKRQIAWRYRDPVLGFLAQSAGAEDALSPEYVAALVSYYEAHFEDALQHLDAIGSGLPWFYEAPELRGDVLLARAVMLRRQGKSERARSDFEAARKAYAVAAAIGESVPAVYTSLGDLEHAAMVMELYGEGDVMPPFERGMTAAGHALALMPDSRDALVLKARIQRSLAEHHANQGMNVDDLLSHALADAQRAVQVSAALARPQALLEVSRIYRQWGDVRAGRNQDPSEQLRQAAAIADQISPQDRDPQYYNNLGLVFSMWADHEDSIGVDSKVNRGRANAAFTKALQIDHKMSEAWTNLGINSFKQASNPRAKDPDGDTQQAIEVLDRSKAINPDNWIPYFYQGNLYELRAQRKLARGSEPDQDVNLALKAYQSGLDISRGVPQLHNGVGAALLDQAQALWDRGKDPEPVLSQAQDAFSRAISVAPEQVFGYGNVGEVHALRAWFRRAQGQDPSSHVDEAMKALNQAIALSSKEVTYWADLGMAHAIQAAYTFDHGEDPQPSLGRAEQAITRALDIDQTNAQSWLYRGETLGLAARFQARHGHGRAADFARAEQAFQKAIALDSERWATRLAFGHFYRAWAEVQRDEGDRAPSSLQRGLELASEALAHRPHWPDALVLRASLTLLKAQSATAIAQRHALADEALADLAEARRLNPALGKAWESQATLAQQIGTAP